MAGPSQTLNTPFSFKSDSKPVTLNHQTIIWLVVLSCILVVAFVIIACLLCRCRRKRKDRRVSRGYSVKDGRNDFHPWNKDVAPLPVVPSYGGYGVNGASGNQNPIASPSRVAMRPPDMEPIIVEEGDNSAAFQRSSRKSSRYYGGWGKRISTRFSQIGRAM